MAFLIPSSTKTLTTEGIDLTWSRHRARPQKLHTPWAGLSQCQQFNLWASFKNQATLWRVSMILREPVCESRREADICPAINCSKSCRDNTASSTSPTA